MKSLKVSEDVWCAVKVQAAKDQISMKKFIETALWIAVGKSAKTNEQKKE